MRALAILFSVLVLSPVAGVDYETGNEEWRDIQRAYGAEKQGESEAEKEKREAEAAKQQRYAEAAKRREATEKKLRERQARINRGMRR